MKLNGYLPKWHHRDQIAAKPPQFMEPGATSARKFSLLRATMLLSIVPDRREEGFDAATVRDHSGSRADRGRRLRLGHRKVGAGRSPDGELGRGRQECRQPHPD